MEAVVRKGGIVWLVAILGFSAPAFAQLGAGNLTGSVTDPQTP